MQTSTKRDIIVFMVESLVRAHGRATPPDSARKSVEDCLIELEAAASEAGKPVDMSSTPNSALGLRLRQVVPRPDSWALLVSLSDLESSEPVFENHDSMELRQIKKTPREGGSVSAHLVVRRSPMFTGAHIAALEVVPRLGRSVVDQGLNRLLRSRTGGNFQTRGGKWADCWTKLGLNTYSKHSLVDEIRRGKLAHVELTRVTSDVRDFGETWKPRKTTVLRLSPVGPIEKLKESISSLANTAQPEWESMKVVYTTESGKSGSLRMDADRFAQATDLLTSRVESVVVARELADAEAEVRVDLVREMETCLNGLVEERLRTDPPSAVE